ncbi:flagellar hook protein FlgE [Kistimonas asteriae]|uniref:flagellar hook protein FlgE n=1 Tax=Kistimonas asteriae TaxID=517724 RepID=UPI001BA75171|nr:flagellar hook protein FlgE [Kistimonas asteriae]
MSFGIGLSGMKAAKQDLEVVSNNIANSNTVGFKSSRVEFADVYASTYSGSNSRVVNGAGVKVSAISQSFQQGNFNYTNGVLDMAITGNGFFVVNDNGSYLYSRAGYFDLDRDNYVVDNLGNRLQGFASDTSGNILSGSITDLQIDSSDMPAQATTALEGLINLDSRSDIPSVATFSSSDPNSYNTTMAFNVYDSLGNPHTLGLYFAKDQTVANQWSIHYQLDGADVGTANTLNFDTDGQISTGSGSYTQTVPAATLANGADALNLNLDLTNMTQLGISSSVNGAIQNGFPPGKMAGIQVSEEGQVQAIYSNGQTLTQGQIILAGFTNEQGLQPVGDSLWRAGYESGDPAYGLAGTGTLGSLQAGALELSNVDLSIELVRLIEAQRNYQSNAKTIETSNSLTQTLMNII